MRVANMKKNKLAMGLSLTILVALYGGGVAQAVQGNHSQNPAGVSDPIASQNLHNKGIKSPHSSRKTAAKRLKVAHQQQHQQELQKRAMAHHGYTGHGKAGGSI